MREPLPQRNTKRFQVALSFAGEHRNFVADVAEHLSRNLGQNRVFYDLYYEAELARPNLDTYLTNIYREDTDLIAIFLCANYAQKEWCGLEWRAIRDVLKQRRDSEQYLSHLSGVDSGVDPPQFSHLGYHLINKKGIGHFRKQF